MSTGSPAASARAIASAPSVSTPQIRTSGISALSATATPEISAPPPMLTRTSVSGGASSASSRPTVPWPATTVGSSNGCTSVMPVRHQLLEQRERAGHVLGQPQLGARSADAIDRPRRSGLRHHDRRAHAHPVGDLRDGDAVIAAAHGDDPRVALDGGQPEQLRRDTPRLERPGPLEQFELERHRNAEERTHPRACHRRRALDMAGDGPRGSADVVEGEQVRHRRHATVAPPAPSSVCAISS